jgi:hypothetical protein
MLQNKFGIHNYIAIHDILSSLGVKYVMSDKTSEIIWKENFSREKEKSENVVKLFFYTI